MKEIPFGRWQSQQRRRRCPKYVCQVAEDTLTILDHVSFLISVFLVAMASTLVAMASTLVVNPSRDGLRPSSPSNVVGMASSLSCRRYACFFRQWLCKHFSQRPAEDRQRKQLLTHLLATSTLAPFDPARVARPFH